MTVRPAPCDPDQLRLLLEDRLPEEEQNALSEHLEQCESCRQMLENLAAETRWWSDVKELAVGADVAPRPTSPGAADVEPGGANALVVPDGFLTPNDDPESLGKIGLYAVSEVIGRGGNGLVLKAVDPALRRLVAIKVLAPELATSAAARRRFAREARAAAAVSHEHVVAIHAVDTAPNGLPYLVMSYVPGQSLQQRLDDNGPLGVKEILRIGMQTAAALAAAHAQGLVHRDIKPANILLENGMERVKITDFGLARAADDASLSQSGVVAGTPQYMAPEQARGETVDHRADLFSLGSVMYAMATGRPPFRADSTMAVLRRVSDNTPSPIRAINPEIPEWLADLIGRLHEKDPAKRFQSAAEVAELLGRCLASVQLATDHVPPYRRDGASGSAPVRRWILAIAAVLVVGLGLGAAEATGVTHLFSTVLRIRTANGTLVMKIDEPGVEVEIDGERIVVSGVGEQPISLDAGTHQLHATKDGIEIKNEPIVITRGGRRVVTIGSDPPVRVKTQAEYLESLRRQTTQANAAPSAASEDAARELARLRRENELLRDRDRRNQARLAQQDGDRTPRAHVGVADSLGQPSVPLVSNTPLAVFELGNATGTPILRDGVMTPTAIPATNELAAPLPKLTATLARAGEPVSALESAPDAQKLAVASGRLIRLWDLAAPNNPPRILEGHTADVAALAFARDGHRLASAGADETVLIWDPATSKEAGRIERLGAGVVSLAFQPNARAIAVVLRGGMVKIFDAESCSLLRELPKQPQPVLIVRYAPDGKLLLTAGGSEDLTQPGLVKLWDSETGTEKATLDGHRYMITAAAFAPDGSTLALGDTPPRGQAGARIYLWNLAKLEQTGFHYVRAGVRALGYSADGTTLAATLQSGNLYVFQMAGSERSTMGFLNAHTGPATGVAFGPQGETLATGGKDGAVKLWTLSSVNVSVAPRQVIPLTEPLATFRDGMGERVWSAVFSPDGKALAACYSVNAVEDAEDVDGAGGLALWDPVGGNLRYTVLSPHVIRAVAFAPDGRTLATAEYDQAVSLRDAADGHVRQTLTTSRQGTSSVAFSHDGRILAAAGLDGVVYLWETATGREKTRFHAHEGPVYTVAFGVDDATIASGGADGDVHLWNLSTAKVRVTLDGHEGPVQQLAFAPDGRTLATASWDQTVKLWRIATGKEIRTLRGHREPVLGLAFSSNGDYLATCAGTWGAKEGPGVGELILWDLVKRRALTPPLSDPKRLLGLAFSTNPKTFATAGWDGTVRLWNVDSVASHGTSLVPVQTAPSTLEPTR